MDLLERSGSQSSIAIGHTNRRMTSNVIDGNVSEILPGILEPIQVGVESSTRCEAVVHVARWWSTRTVAHPSLVAVQRAAENPF